MNNFLEQLCPNKSSSACGPPMWNQRSGRVWRCTHEVTRNCEESRNESGAKTGTKRDSNQECRRSKIGQNSKECPQYFTDRPAICKLLPLSPHLIFQVRICGNGKFLQRRLDLFLAVLDSLSPAYYRSSDDCYSLLLFSHFPCKYSTKVDMVWSTSDWWEL